MEANEEKTVDSDELRDLLRKARLFMECSPLKKVEANFGCLDRDKICADIDVVLAKPRRNCEVGTADEQGERMRTFCLSHEGCHSCEFGTIPLLTLGQCVLEWAQTPYEADAQKGGEE